MIRGEEYVQLLRETTKLTPLVGLTMCAKIYNFCMKQDLFDPMSSIDFMLFLNIREMAMPVNIKSMKKAKVCYVIYRLSIYVLNPVLKDHWISAILSTCDISRVYYDTHYKSIEAGKDFGKNQNKTGVGKFVEDLEYALSFGNIDNF